MRAPAPGVVLWGNALNIGFKGFIVHLELVDLEIKPESSDLPGFFWPFLH